MYVVKLNYKSVYSVENTQAVKIGPMKVFGGDPWFEAVDGQVKNLAVYTRHG